MTTAGCPVRASRIDPIPRYSTLGSSWPAALALSACGGGEPLTPAQFSAAAARCEVPMPDGRSVHISLHNSGISCQRAIAIAIVTPVSYPPGTKVIESGDSWSCREMPSSLRPHVHRCQRGGRYFTFEPVR